MDVEKEIRTDGGSQFTSKMTVDQSSFRFEDLVVAYHHKADEVVECRINEVMIHLRFGL